MHDAKETIKTISLIGLILLAVYQTTELWLGGMSSRNFFAILRQVNHTAPANEAEFRADFFIPGRILTGIGNNRFIVNHPTSKEQMVAEVSAVISTGLAQDDWAVLTDITADLWATRNVVYDFGFDMPSDVYSAEMGGDLEAHLPYFSKMIIEPSDRLSNETYLHFLNNNGGVTYKITSSSIHTTISNHIQNTHVAFTNGEDDLHYISTDIMGFGFETNLFVPMWPGTSALFQRIRPVNNHYANEPSLAEIGANMGQFFRDPASVWMDIREEAFIYGDTTTVVRYQNGLLEYTNFRSSGTRGDVLSDFGVARAFIDRDEMVTNDVFLTGFRAEQDQTVFYFDYIVNNFPLMLSLEERQDKGVDHFLTVTVEHSTVVHYKKVAYSFELTEEVEAYQTDIISFADAFGTDMTTLTFGYLFRNAAVQVGWFFE